MDSLHKPLGRIFNAGDLGISCIANCVYSPGKNNYRLDLISPREHVHGLSDLGFITLCNEAFEVSCKSLRTA